MPVRCLIVDDNACFREEARRLLEREGIAVVATAASSSEALRRLDVVAADIALVDVDLGGESGFDLAAKLGSGSARRPHVILVSIRDESEYVELIATSSAVGFLAKAELSAEAIHRILASADVEGDAG